MRIKDHYFEYFNYLGKRNYVHTTSIFYGIINALEHWSLDNISLIEASFHREIKEHGRYDLFDGAPVDLVEKGYCTVFNITCNEKNICIGLRGNGKLVDESIPYNENNLIQNSYINKKEKIIGLKYNSVDYIINVLVALTKKLHLEIFDNKNFGRWMVAKLELKWGEILYGHKKIEIKLLRNIGDTTTKSKIQINNDYGGYIIFNRKALL